MEMTGLSELRRADEAHLIHPFTDPAEIQRQGTHIVRGAEGCYVVDETGRQLFDGLAGLWCVNVGYGRQEIADAVFRQMSSLSYYPSFFNSTTEPAIRLAEKLAGHTPSNIRRVFFSNSGSEANETALKFIRAYQKLRGKPGKQKILSRTFSYHGVGVATASLTGLPTLRESFDLPVPGFVYVPGPHPYGVSSELSAEEYGKWCIAETEKTILAEGADTIAAIFVEPVQGAGGVIVPPPGYLTALRALARRYDILFVADEVITAFGRLGAWFASSMWELAPDILTTAKGISSGYLPLAATFLADDVADVIASGGYLAHGFTYSAHPVTTAAGLANLEILEREGLVERVRDDVGPYFEQMLHSFRGHPAVGETRACGLIGALDLVPRGGKAALGATPVLGARAVGLARDRGLIVRGIRDLIALSPPLIVTRPQIDWIRETLRDILDSLWDEAR